MKIIPKKVIPAKVQFTKPELIELWNFLYNEKGYNDKNYERWSWRQYRESLEQCLRIKDIYHIDATDPDKFWICPPNTSGGFAVSIKEFEGYCRRVGLVNSKKYEVT